MKKLFPTLLSLATGSILLTNVAIAGLPSYLKNDDPDRVAYGIETKTWNATDDAPYVTLTGTKGACSKFKLDNKPNNFGTGKKDYFILTGQQIGDCGFPTKITFTANGTDGWGVENVYVDYFLIPEPSWHWMNTGPAWFSQFKDYNNRNNVIKTATGAMKGVLVSNKPIKMQGKKGVDGDGDSAGGIKFTKAVTLNAVGSRPPSFTVERGDFIAVPGSWRAIINAGGTAVNEREQALTMTQSTFKEVGSGGTKSLETALGMSTTVSAEVDVMGATASASTTVSSSITGSVSNYFSNTASTAKERSESQTNKLTCNAPRQPSKYTIWAWTNKAKVMGQAVTHNTCLYACSDNPTIPPQKPLGGNPGSCPGV